MKKLWKYGNNKALKGILIMMCAVLLFAMKGSVCFADATGKVTAPSAKIRKSADINSEVIGSSSSGKTITITAEVTDASGTLWYEVYVDSNTKGYIRSDLVSKDASSGEVPSRTAQSTAAAITAADTTQTPEAAASGAELPAETEMEAQYATVKVPAAKIRGGASTTKGVVDTIPQNTQVVVSGKTDGSDGKAWYYITFTGTNGQEKTGYVRNDLVELGELVPAGEPEDTPQDEQQPQDEPEEEQENKDYEVVYENGEDGEEWYLHDNLSGTKNKLADLLEAAQAQEFNDSVDASTITRQRIVIIILIALISIMAFAMTFMVFKLRDAYYEAYEEEEDEEPYKNRREEVTTRKPSSREREQQPPVRKRTAEPEKRIPIKEVTYEEEPGGQIKPAQKKKAKNFMIDDEDFEFEFLNMKNKNNDR